MVIRFLGWLVVAMALAFLGGFIVGLVFKLAGAAQSTIECAITWGMSGTAGLTMALAWDHIFQSRAN